MWICINLRLYSFPIHSVFAFCTTKESSGTIPESKESSYRGKEGKRVRLSMLQLQIRKQKYPALFFFFLYMFTKGTSSEGSLVQANSFNICVTLRTLNSISVSQFPPLQSDDNNLLVCGRIK